MKPPGPEFYRPWRVRRFAVEARDSAGAPDDTKDYLESAFLYRRMPPSTFDGNPIDTTMRWFIGSSATFLHSASRNGGTTGRRREDDEADSMDGLLTCMVTAGRFEVETNGIALDLCEGDVFVLDTAVPHVMRDYPGHIAVVFAPRTLVAQVMDASGIGTLAGQSLSDTELADLFRLQIRYLTGALDRIAPAAFDVALTTTSDIALAMIRHKNRRADGAASSLIARARMVIASGGTDPGMTPTRIAALLNISRSRLYEVFAAQGMTLTAYLRDYRLRMFLELLRSHPDETIQTLAYRAGFGGDPSDFTKLFRRIYGVLPSEMRAALLTEQAISRDGAQ